MQRKPKELSPQQVEELAVCLSRDSGGHPSYLDWEEQLETTRGVVHRVLRFWGDRPKVKGGA